MFNKTLFNRNAFNRSVSLSSISVSIVGSGTIATRIVMRIESGVKTMAGTSVMSCGVVMRQQVGLAIDGNSSMINDALNLSMSLKPVRFSGTGDIVPKFSVRTPMNGNLSGDGDTKIDNRMRIQQHMTGIITSSGKFTTEFINHTPLIINLTGASTLKGLIALPIPIPMNLAGSSELTLRRLSAANVNTFELIDINLLPGETVTIDTDLLQVLFGIIEDVSSVTSDSIFFELNPGENEITISTDSDTTLEVTAIWQNRWL